MYYDQGGLDEPQRPPYAVPYQMPSAGGMPPAIAPLPGAGRRRQGSYADYYNGRTGSVSGGNSLKPTTWAEAQQQWEEQQRRLYPRGLIGGRRDAVLTPQYGQLPYMQGGQYRPMMGGGVPYRRPMLRNAAAMENGPAPQAMQRPLPQYQRPNYGGYGSHMQFTPGVLR